MFSVNKGQVDSLRIGTRKSALAVTQAQFVADFVASKGLQCHLVRIESEGDRDLNTPLYETEGALPGVFTKRLEKALLDSEIDLAVHSLKDLPTRMTQGLMLAAIPKREFAGDCIVVSKKAWDSSSLWGLKRASRIGTSSLRREAQILSQRQDLKVGSVRGNVPTRVEKVRSGELDAVVLAKAGLIRLGLDLSDLHLVDLPQETFVPAPGQGALAVQSRTDLHSVAREALSTLHHLDSALETETERSVLRELMGGCTLPLGVRCRRSPKSESWELKGFLGIDKVHDGQREWVAFHHFECEGSEPLELVKPTVDYFKSLPGYERTK